MPPDAVDAFETVLPPPTVTAVLPAPTLTLPSLFTALPVPVDSVPLTVAAFVTLIVRALIVEPLKPSGSAVVQVIVVPSALARQSASAAPGDAMAPMPMKVVPMRRR